LSTVQSSTFASERPVNPEWPFGFPEAIELLRRRGSTVLKIAVVFMALTAVMLLVWPSRYSSTAVVMLDPRKNNITDRSQVLTGLPTDPASVQDQIQILTSHDLAALVVDRLHLADDPEFNRALAPFPMNLLAQTPQRSAIVNTFLSHLTVESEGLSTAVSVTFSAKQPDEAARISNTVVKAYIDSQIAQKYEAAQRTTRWLDLRIAELARQVQNGDSAVQSYKAANGLNDSGQGTQSLVDQQLAAVNSQLVQSRADLAEKQATYDHVAALVKSGRATEVSQVVSSPLIVQLRQQQADAIRNQAELDSHYGPKHPKRIAAESQLRDLDSKVELEAERIAGSVANDVAVARAQVRSLEISLASMRSESNVQNLARVKLRALEASAASTRSMYESFVTRLRETQDPSDVTTPDARIISHASVPTRPSSPPRLLILCASLPAGLLLGFLCALVMESAGDAWRRGKAVSVARLLTPPVVAVVPGAHRLSAADQIVAAPASPFSTAMFGLAARLASFSIASRPRTILVSGFDAGDAVASVAVGLARALALRGHNVMLVDADPARCAAARMAGSADSPGGMHEVLRGAVPLSRAVAKDRSSPVLILANSPEGIARAHWEAGATTALFQHLRQVCDFAIIHAPAQSDMLALVSMAEGVLFVGAAGQAESLAKMAATFTPSARHLGLVLTA
jgi:succinoglycan biosynthesis transport protein ExoP